MLYKFADAITPRANGEDHLLPETRRTLAWARGKGTRILEVSHVVGLDPTFDYFHTDNIALTRQGSGGKKTSQRVHLWYGEDTPGRSDRAVAQLNDPEMRERAHRVERNVLRLRRALVAGALAVTAAVGLSAVGGSESDAQGPTYSVGQLAPQVPPEVVVVASSSVVVDVPSQP